MSPRISIVLPCYNAADHLQDTLDSLVAQTFSDFECIAIDDGSRDSTLAILNAQAARDARFKIISRENRGLIATLNEGIALAQGEWIARMDNDDIAHPERLAVQLAHLEETGADVCGTWIRFFGDRSGEWRLPTEHEAIRAQLMFGVSFAHPTVMARTSLLKAHPYNPHMHYGEDYALWCDLAMAGAKFTNVPRILLDYRTHAKQMSQLGAAEQRATSQRVREAYIPYYLPEDLRMLAPRLVELADSAHPLTPDGFYWLSVLMLRLNKRQPACRQSFGSLWLDALQRTPHAGISELWFTRHLLRPLPLPRNEWKRFAQLAIRCIFSQEFCDWVRGRYKKPA